MKNVTGIIILLVFVFISMMGCQDVTVGYLMTSNATYTPDSMVVKAVLDPVEDERQIKFEIPWQSAPIEGVQRTFPMVYSIKSVASDNGHPEVASQFTVARKGVIELPWNHTVPPGRYVFTLEVSNEGYTRVLDSIYTVIVK